MRLSNFTTEDIRSAKELEFNLYHGTSSVFLDSIMREGFGYRDNDIFNEEILKRLWENLKDTNLKYVRAHSYIIPDMIEQCGRLKYKGVYLTPSKAQAIRYAKNNPYGEYLSTIYNCYNTLSKMDEKKANLIIPTEHPLKKIFNTRPKPILITLENANISKLEGEDKLNINTLLKDIYKTYWDTVDWADDEAIDVLMEQKDIVLKEVLESDLIQVEYLNA